MPKIATCSYCGTRAALILDRGRHELTCAACGAPLHEIKALRTDRPEPIHPHRPTPRPDFDRKPSKPKKRKKNKTFRRKAAKELWDLLDDIFD